MNNCKKTIIWKTSFGSYHVASVRYRCLLVAMALKKYGYESVLLHKKEVPDSFNGVCALVFVKTFSEHDLILAQKAHQKGIPIYIDLCDNIFTLHNKKNMIYICFKEIAELATAVVTTGSELSKVIAGNLKRNIPILEISDQVEPSFSEKALVMEVRSMRRRLIKFNKKHHGIYEALFDAKYLFLDSLVVKTLTKVRNGFVRMRQRKMFSRQFFTAGAMRILISPSAFLESKAKLVVWFGNAGSKSSKFGLVSLVDIVDELIQANKTTPVKLLVISNNHEAYLKLIKPLPILSAYKSWCYDEIFEDLAEADVCVIPNSKNDFSICKSPNRTLLALSLGLPVVATNIPSLLPVAHCIVMDNWQEGLYTYLNDKKRVNKDICSAKKVLDERYSGKVIAGLWDELLRAENNFSERVVA